jgi:tyrosine-protein kinase Etk/Wzc
LGDVPSAGLDYIRAERELKYRQAILDILMRQYDAARLDEAQDAAIIQVLEPAVAPDQQSSPERIWIILISALAGLCSGCLFAMFSWWQSILRSDPERAGQLRNMRGAFLGRESPATP